MCADHLHGSYSTLVPAYSISIFPVSALSYCQAAWSYMPYQDWIPFCLLHLAMGVCTHCDGVFLKAKWARHLGTISPHGASCSSSACALRSPPVAPWPRRSDAVGSLEVFESYTRYSCLYTSRIPAGPCDW